uniref:Sushi, von Willebrand factor type A, EGF and pentraxin domain-containing protein 1 n=1 Tax=Strigamia maritima TaxID=126957 RepID=T1IZH1_STRMM
MSALNQWFYATCFISLLSIANLQGGLDIFEDSNKLYTLSLFQDTLNTYSKQPMDVVFVLDESGSVGATYYETEKDFVEIIARTLSISSDDTRTALVRYNGGSTNTASGLTMANTRLSYARPSTKKVIILLSDGLSNDGEPPIVTSARLKASGIIMFCVGIAQANEAELRGIATSPSHIYIIKDFEYVKQVYLQLRQDIQNTAFAQQPKHYCQGTCDLNADCYCGTDGKYTCYCNAGYMGSGQIGLCTRCPKLHAPIGGHLDPKECGTALNDKCTFWCDTGYCPYNGSEPECLQKRSRKLQTPKRVCLITKKWSGPDFRCEEARCVPPKNPENGVFECNSINFQVKGTVCTLKCNVGYKLDKHSKSQIRCQATGIWNHIEKAKCIPVQCDPITVKNRINLKPKECGTNVQTFNQHCQLYCKTGYDYVGTKPNQISVRSPYGLRICDVNGWTGRESYTCKDTERPVITCPKSIKVSCPPDKKVTLIYPPFTKSAIAIKPPHRFPPGKNKLVYQAKDRDDLVSTCSFIIEVEDIKPPTVQFCPESIDHYTTSTNPITLDWEKPEFDDNSDHVRITYQSHQPKKDKFSPNQSYRIKYIGTDYYNNTVTCEFEIRLIPYQCLYKRPPLHGKLSCNKIRLGQECTVTCNKGFMFHVEKPLPVYKCLVKGGIADWDPIDKTWPDCSNQNDVKTSTTQVTIQSKKINCKRLETNKRYADRIVATACKNRPKCNIENIKISCHRQSKKKQHKRDLKETEGEESILTIEFDVTLSEILVPYLNKLRLDSNNKSKSLSEIEREQNKELQAAVEDLASSEGLVVALTKNYTITCDIGQVFSNGKCVNCPAGTFYRDKSCNQCQLHKFQDKQASTQCNPCPENTFTLARGSISAGFCLNACGPGTYSKTGLEQCTACAKGFYQDLQGQTSCKPCHLNTSTWITGAESAKYCQAECQPGSFSPTRLEPCNLCPRGSYQPRAGKSFCIPCNGTLYTLEAGMRAESTCIEVDICTPNPCQYNGNCTITDTYEARCDCVEGIAGPLCEINLNDCTLDSCFNNGICIDGIDDYSCECAAGYEGPRCQDDINNCQDGVCLNGGTCIDGVNSFTCKCLTGYAGHVCQYALDKCNSNPCYNHGKCINQKDGFLCCCKNGFSGPFCEIKDNDCINSNPCLHGSKCVQTSNNYKCVCSAGYSGINCEENIDECKIQPCLNHGTCSDGIDNFECKCSPGFEGKTCETALSSDFDVEFRAAKISNYAIVETKEDLLSLTVMFWMKADANGLSRGTPVSFSYKSPINGSVVANAITWYDVNKFIIFIQNQEIRTTITGDSQWHNYALTWDSFGGTYSVFIDGKFLFTGSNISPGIPLFRGFFVLGQEQDLLASGFSSTESFVGLISQFNVWNFAMNEKEILKVSSRCGYVGNVVAWPDVKTKFLGSDVFVRASGHCRSIGSCGITAECFCQMKNIHNVNLCERSVETCSSNVCYNGQKCIRDGETQMCQCQIGFGGRFCQHDINECFTNNGNCSHECHNTLGSYYCTCPSDFYMSDDNKTCLPTSRCNYKGSFYTSGYTWTENCETCTCDEGRLTCKQQECPAVHCSQGKPVIFPGECCKKCIDKSIANCVVLSNNLYQTFDGDDSIKLRASCRHILVQDCTDGSFTVQIENSARTPSQKKLTINIGCETIRIDFDGIVVLQKREIDLPYNGNLFRIEKELSSPNSKKKTIGVIIEWSNYGRVDVKVLDNMKDKLCGLCGNYNGNGNDDWMMRNYKQAGTMTEFAFSWRVNKKSCPPPEYEVKGTPEYKKVGACLQEMHKDKWQSARSICKILRDAVFHPCYKHVDPQGYLDRCLQDGCRCGDNLCQCKSIELYQATCRKYVGVKTLKRSGCPNP